MRLSACFCIQGDKDQRIVVIQDTFGKQFRVFPKKQIVGSVVEVDAMNGGSEFPIADGPCDTHPAMIIAAVHANTVRAVVRRCGETEPIQPGFWYEIHSD